MMWISRNENGEYFRGILDNPEDAWAAMTLAKKCPVYSIDEDDEDYCDGERTCFNCRYRRWLADGFQCARGRLAGQQ